MPEDAGKKKFIKDFLQSIKAGEGFNGDIHVERSVKLPGTEGKSSTAQSLSGRPVNTITQLLEDDLKRSFDEGYFTFRFVAALVGSGKTFLLTYLHERIKTHQNYESLSVVSRFKLSDLLSSSGSQRFSIKLYCYLLAQTFWELLNSSNQSIKDVASGLLNDYLDSHEVVQLEGAKKQKPFRSKFTKYLSESGVIFEEFFFEVVEEVSKVEPQFTFAYLIDELDSLQNYPKELQETRSLIKALVKRAFDQDSYKSKIRILIYFVGTSDNVLSFIDEDSVIESLVGHSVINLSQGYGNEFEAIKEKIDNRIEGAFKGYKKFDLAWQEIKNIPLNKAQNLRTFCQKYATEVLEIYENYFCEEPEKRFEGNARELVEAQCRQGWEKYLRQKSYTLSAVSTTTILEGHAFDCYIELLHNDSCIARGFGEAKNYELLTSHLDTFYQWLEDVKFKSFFSERTPPDLAFMISPSCPSLLQRKLELKNINFIRSDKIIETPEKKDSLNKSPLVVNLNTADKTSIVSAVKGTRLQRKKIDKLIARRKYKKYKTLEELTSDLRVGDSVKQKLQEKMENGKICLVE